MTFTDDDLKRLKEVLNCRESPLCLPLNRLRDLLARLEAAEVFIKLFDPNDPMLSFLAQQKIIAWLKASGK